MSGPRVLAALAQAALLAACASGGSGAGPDGEFRDCAGCPVMLTIPAGSFAMGSLPEETQGRGWPAQAGGNERPRHEVRIAREFALGKYEVTRGQYAAFVADVGYDDTGGCLDFRNGAMGVVAVAANDWRSPGFSQGDEEPVTCVSWLDAQAYVAWLARRTGRPYRLPSEAEWEYAGRAGTTSAYPWGEDVDQGCAFANVRARPDWKPDPASPAAEAPYLCDDGHPQTAPAGSYRPNGFGLHDMVGNVFEWTEDCNHPSFDGAPADGSAWVDDPACVFRIMKGGSFANSARQTRSAARVGRPVSGRAPMLGFRVALSLDGAEAAAGAARAGVTAVAVAGVAPADAALFRARCAGCHVDGRSFRGVYGRDLDTVERVIREGGANSMSMPAWRDELSEGEIRRLAVYVRKAAGWE